MLTLNALKNFTRDLTAQLRRRGALWARLRCVLAYWYWYATSRQLKSDPVESRLHALDRLARKGLYRQLVTVRWADLTATLDVFSAAFLTQELLDDGQYLAPGFELNTGETVIDVGAHQGLFTLPAARAVGPTGRVVALEPYPDNHALLQRNVCENWFPWVQVLGMAALDQPGREYLHVVRRVTGGHSFVYPSETHEELLVETVTLDQIVQAFNLSHVSLVKIDVEGSWRRVFAGAPKLLSQRPRLVMEAEGGESECELVMKFLNGLGYHTFSRHSIVFALPRGNSYFKIKPHEKI